MPSTSVCRDVVDKKVIEVIFHRSPSCWENIVVNTSRGEILSQIGEFLFGPESLNELRQNSCRKIFNFMAFFVNIKSGKEEFKKNCSRVLTLVSRLTEECFFILNSGNHKQGDGTLGTLLQEAGSIFRACEKRAMDLSLLAIPQDIVDKINQLKRDLIENLPLNSRFNAEDVAKSLAEGFRPLKKPNLTVPYIWNSSMSFEVGKESSSMEKLPALGVTRKTFQPFKITTSDIPNASPRVSEQLVATPFTVVKNGFFSLGGSALLLSTGLGILNGCFYVGVEYGLNRFMRNGKSILFKLLVCLIQALSISFFPLLYKNIESLSLRDDSISSHEAILHFLYVFILSFMTHFIVQNMPWYENASPRSYVKLCARLLPLLLGLFVLYQTEDWLEALSAWLIHFISQASVQWCLSRVLYRERQVDNRVSCPSPSEKSLQLTTNSGYLVPRKMNTQEEIYAEVYDGGEYWKVNWGKSIPYVSVEALYTEESLRSNINVNQWASNSPNYPVEQSEKESDDFRALHGSSKFVSYQPLFFKNDEVKNCKSSIYLSRSQSLSSIRLDG